MNSRSIGSPEKANRSLPEPNDSTFYFQPVLRKQHFEYICKLIPGGQVLTCSNLDGTRTEPRSYYVSYVSRGCADGKGRLAMMFRRLSDPVLVHHFEALPNGDFKWLRGEEYDPDFDEDDLSNINMEVTK